VSRPTFLAPTPWFPLPARLAILLSGRGSNFEALADAVDSGALPARIVSVISDVPDAPGLRRARERGLRAAAFARRDFENRSAHEAAIGAELAAVRPDLICLAGFMRLLSPSFCERWTMRIVNIHPSLLPSFSGLHAQRQALEWGVKVSGATVHFVDAGLDSGPIVEQAVVPVEPNDVEDLLAVRILAVEHQLYPRAVARLLHGNWRLLGRRLEFGV
jgi:phosphoribosylglycinamide formyltransferase-1